MQTPLCHHIVFHEVLNLTLQSEHKHKQQNRGFRKSCDVNYSMDHCNKCKYSKHPENYTSLILLLYVFQF